MFADPFPNLNSQPSHTFPSRRVSELDVLVAAKMLLLAIVTGNWTSVQQPQLVLEFGLKRIQSRLKL